ALHSDGAPYREGPRAAQRRAASWASGSRAGRAGLREDSFRIPDPGQRFAQGRELVVRKPGGTGAACVRTHLGRGGGRRFGGFGRRSVARRGGRQRLNALLLEQLLDALDRVAFLVEQALDQPQPVDVVRAVITPPAGPLERPDLGKAGLPEAQHMLRQVKRVRDLTDRPVGFRALFHRRILRRPGGENHGPPPLALAHYRLVRTE